MPAELILFRRPAATREMLLRHHTFLRKQIVRAEELYAAAVLEQRPPLCGILLPLHRLFEQFRIELEGYLELEETNLPSLLDLDADRYPLTDVAETVRLLRYGQAALSSFVAEMRELTNGFQAPCGACAPYSELLSVLSSVGKELQLEFRLEREGLFICEMP